LVLITGPSKTSDIQQTLAYGAHGPKELVIVLVNDLESPSPELPQ
jgi:L-lactate dehydrogenase complex protein LldG